MQPDHMYYLNRHQFAHTQDYLEIFHATLGTCTTYKTRLTFALSLCCVGAFLMPNPGGGGWPCCCDILFMISPSTGLVEAVVEPALCIVAAFPRCWTALLNLGSWFSWLWNTCGTRDAILARSNLWGLGIFSLNAGLLSSSWDFPETRLNNGRNFKPELS